MLTAAEVYCFVRPEVKRVKKKEGTQAAVQLWEKDANNVMQVKRHRQQIEEEQVYEEVFERIKNDIKTYRVMQAQVIS